MKWEETDFYRFRNDGKRVRFFRYVDFLKEKYGERIQKLTVLTHMTCPNRDGSKGVGGCIYCNNDSFAPPAHLREMTVGDQVERGIVALRRRYVKAKKFLVYLQAYSNTYESLPVLEKIYSEALAHPEVIGLAIGTRPDCLDERKMDYLKELNQQYDITIELGIESFSDECLRRINRGHDVATSLWALEELDKRDIPVCAHLIAGLPGDSRANFLESAKQVNQLPIHFLKLHQLHVVRDTKLFEEFLEDPFPLFEKEEYFDLIAHFLEDLNPSIVIQRLFGEAPEHLIVAPLWEKNLSELLYQFSLFQEERDSFQGKNFSK